MKCSRVVSVCLFVCLARFCDAGALRCPPGVSDPSCTEENPDLLDTKEATEAQCLVGSEWESNCHYCRCSDEGVAECLKQDTCDKEIFAEPIQCKPNTTFQRDCNTCICLENGLGLCTLEFCRRSGDKDNLEVLLEDTDEESTTKSDKSDIVVPVVHRLEGNFLEHDDVIKILKRSTICKPLEEFMRECNPCKCAADGLSYSCTHNECLDTDTSKEVEVFMQSEKFKASAKNGTKQVCEANRMFIKDCNTCWCNEDGTSYVCTRKVCVPLLPDEEPDLGGIPAENLRVIEKECRPDEVFELDCNMCRCNPDGKSYACTRRACEQQLDEDKKVTLSRKVRAFSQDEPTKHCQPGQEFRMDCNKCLCDNEGIDFSCTRIDCNAANNNHASLMGLPFTGTRTKRETQQVEVKCEPGSVFDRDCNVCRCTDDGHRATCSLKRCRHADSAQAPESDPGFRCNAGEQFKRNCNDCTCSADGKSVFCTIRLCDLNSDK